MSKRSNKAVKRIKPSKYSVQFGRLVATKRLELGMTQEQLAKKIGVARTTITNIERGKQRTMLDHALKIAEELMFPLFDTTAYAKLPAIKRWSRS